MKPEEGKLVEKLRENPKFAPELSLVVETDGKIVGHVLLFPIIIKSAAGKEKVTISLAPVSVRPEFHKQGIGSELIRERLKACRRSGHDYVAVLGHPDYYQDSGSDQK